MKNCFPHWRHFYCPWSLSVFVEKITFASSKQDNTVKAVRVPPIIAPGMRGSKTFNTEMEKKSVYLGGKFFEKDKINGTCIFFTFFQFRFLFLVSY